MSNIYNSGHPAFEKLKLLIDERTKKDADKKGIDQKIWSLFGGSTAVMFTDLAGFSRRVVEFGIIHFLQIIFESQKLFSECILQHDGHLVKAEGDSLIITFKEPRQALECAIEMQKKCHLYNLHKEAAEKILLCVGLGYGNCLKIGDVDIFGAEVNAASKLGEDIAKAGEILLTSDFKKACEADSGHTFDALDVVPPGSTENAFRLKYDTATAG